MGFLEMMVGNLLSLTAFGMIMAGLLKIFRMSTDLSEIKDILREIQREHRPIMPPSGNQTRMAQDESNADSAVALMRAVDSEAAQDGINYDESTGLLRRP